MTPPSTVSCRSALLLRLCSFRYIPLGTAHANPVGSRAIVFGAMETVDVAWTSYPIDPEVALFGSCASGDNNLNGTVVEMDFCFDLASALS